MSPFLIANNNFSSKKMTALVNKLKHRNY